MTGGGKCSWPYNSLDLACATYAKSEIPRSARLKLQGNMEIGTGSSMSTSSRYVQTVLIGGCKMSAAIQFGTELPSGVV